MRLTDSAGLVHREFLPAHNPAVVDMLVTPGMKVLYVIALLSFAALLWAAFAIARHVRKGAAPAQLPVADNTPEVLEQRLSSLTRTPPETRSGSQTASRPDAS